MEGIGVAASLSQVVPGTKEDLEWLQAQSPCDPELAKWVARSPPASKESALQAFSIERTLETSMRSLTDGGL
jgi:hypothetical protein